MENEAAATIRRTKKHMQSQAEICENEYSSWALLRPEARLTQVRMGCQGQMEVEEPYYCTVIYWNQYQVIQRCSMGIRDGCAIV